MDESAIREIFSKSVNVVNDTAKGIGEINKKIDKIHSDLSNINGEELTKETDAVIEEYLSSLTTASDIIEVLEYRLKDLERFAGIVSDIDVNIDKLEQIEEMIKRTDELVSDMVAETTKWKNKGGKMKSYEDKRRGLKKNMDAMEFDDGGSLALQSKKIDGIIKYFENKIKNNKNILSAME